MKPRTLKLSSFFLLLGVALAVAAVYVYKTTSYSSQKTVLAAEVGLGPKVNTAKVARSPAERLVTVIGEARPYAQVTLYAKLSGYLKDVLIDKGDLVKKDQILAVIESPETDRDYEGAKADAKNKRAIADRYKPLLKKHLVSPQEAEQAESDAEVAESHFNSLAVFKSYETLRAPFDGMVTARFADPGALMQSATGSQTSALPVVTVSDFGRLRVYGYLDQKDATFVKVNDPVKITMNERSKFMKEARVTRMSGELDSRTRMLLVEVDVDNPDSVENNDNVLVPGSFVQLAFTIKTESTLQVPIAALVIRDGKSFVGVIKNNKVTYSEVNVRSNDGALVSIVDGLKEGDEVALNIGNGLTDGSVVRPVAGGGP